MTHQTTAGNLPRTRTSERMTWPPQRHTVVALFEDYPAAAADATSVQMAQPDLEPTLVRPTDTPFAPAGTARTAGTAGTAWTAWTAWTATLAVRTADDRAVARALAAKHGVQFVYRAGAWANEFIMPSVA